MSPTPSLLLVYLFNKKTCFRISNCAPDHPFYLFASTKWGKMLVDSTTCRLSLLVLHVVSYLDIEYSKLNSTISNVRSFIQILYFKSSVYITSPILLWNLLMSLYSLPSSITSYFRQLRKKKYIYFKSLYN